MKKYIKYISFCFLAITGLASCEPDDNGYKEDPRDVGAYANLSDGLITSFDTNEELAIELFTNDGVTFESIEIFQGDQSIATATIVSDSLATFNASALGNLDTIFASDDPSVAITIQSTLSNGKMATDPFTITVTEAISLDENPEVVRYMDTTETALSFTTYTSSATIDNVSLFRKIGADGEYVPTEEELDVDGDAIDLGDINYDELGVGVGDTIYYRFVAESGELSQEVVAPIAIQPQGFEASATTTLSNDSETSQFNLGTGEYPLPGETGEIMFVEPQGFSTSEGIDFVEVAVPDDMTSAEYFSGTGLIEAEEAYEEGNKITSVDEVEMGDVFIYKVTRQVENEDETVEEKVYYGIIRIANVTTVNEDSVSLEIEYAEGTIIRE